MRRSLTDLFKVIAAVAVVGIHATSQSETRFAAAHNFDSLDFLSVVVNQWARFSVPLFIYFSGYGLTISQKQTEDIGLFKTWLAFLGRRLPTILVPYLFFSSLALALEFHSYTGPADVLWNSIATKLRTGGADYHLYFLVILAQCYLLFPVLSKFARGQTTSFTLATWLALILVSGLLYKGSSEILLGKLGVTHPGWHASFVVYWLPYFMLGGLHALEPPRAVHRVPMTIALIVAQAIVLFEYIHYSWQATPVDYYNHFSRPSVMFYALIVIWWLHSQTDRWGRLKSTPSVGEKLAPLTFSVYLIHPQVLRLVTNYLPGLPTLFGWMLVVVTTFVLVYGLTLLTNKAHEKGPGFLTGPVQFLQRCIGLR